MLGEVTEINSLVPIGRFRALYEINCTDGRSIFTTNVRMIDRVNPRVTDKIRGALAKWIDLSMHKFRGLINFAKNKWTRRERPRD